MAAALPALLLLAALRLAAGQAAPPLPHTQTALWVNTFAAVVSLDCELNATQTVLEDALRDQYTSAGYAVDIVDVKGCPLAPPAMEVGSPASAPASSPASSPAATAAALAALPPVPAPAAAALAKDSLAPRLVRAACLVLNVTLSFDPRASNMYLDAAAGTSGAIIQSLRAESEAEGLQAELYLLGVRLLPGISQVTRTGDSLQRVLEVAGPSLEVNRTQRLALLAAVRSLGLEASAGVTRYRVDTASRNATGFGFTLLAIVRPATTAVLYTQAFAALAANQTLLAALRAMGLPAASVSLVANTQDNSTTVGSQLSAVLARNPVVSSIGPPGVTVNATNNATSDVGLGASTPVDQAAHRKVQPLSAGAIAGVAIGSAVTLATMLGVLLLHTRRRRKATLESDRKPAQHASADGVPWLAPPPTPSPSPDGASPASVVVPVTGEVQMLQTARRHSLAVSAWSIGSWQLPPHSIDICCLPDGSDHVLGRGTYGVVYKALLDGEQEVAVKMLNRIDDWQLQQFRREIDLLRALPANPNVVQFYGACLDCECPFLVLEYMAGGDLREALSDPDRAPLLSWPRNGQRVALDVARGLSFLHAHGVIHADLKSKNVLLSADCSQAKVGDVGLSRIMQGSHASAASDAFTFTYAAPEQILGYKLTPQVDSFAFSVLLWELATQEPPVRGQLHTIDSPRQCPRDIAQLIERGLARNPAERPSVEEACQVIAALAERFVRIPDIDVVPQLQLQRVPIRGWSPIG